MKNLKIMVTGDLGYIGSVLAPLLVKRGYEVAGLDIGYFADCLLGLTQENHKRHFKDIRNVSSEDMRGIGAVIHLAGLSNDPAGALRPELTEQINLDATVRLGQLAKSVGVRRFIYASSQSMYGISSSSEELDEDSSEKLPLTTYARTKWEAEIALK